MKGSTQHASVAEKADEKIPSLLVPRIMYVFSNSSASESHHRSSDIGFRRKKTGRQTMKESSKDTVTSSIYDSRPVLSSLLLSIPSQMVQPKNINMLPSILCPPHATSGVEKHSAFATIAEKHKE